MKAEIFEKPELNICSFWDKTYKHMTYHPVHK